ncbi:MipA/OmpV family protein [Pleionea litopenaei]|uniref:MipA/OmpV family protein n=1 Tax=Pleionea litopenaei TaxID=3070815 RepID=A0AA51RVS8_9GAMM|nr:MipA/OmpV family protein [Pleionea sp. HL-JVS1]WMS88415.1 MipA/OmpV family protein [Pleionea sp. HL-JVS1]
MRKFTSIVLLILFNWLFHQTALAQNEKTVVVPLPSVDDFSKGNDGWSFGLGFGIEYESAYEGSDEFGFEVQPAGAVQWRNGNDTFYWAGEALGWRGLRSDTWLLEAAIAFDEGREEGDSDDGYLNGLGDQEEGTEIVLQARRALDDNWRNWLISRIVTGDNGNLGLFGIGHRFGVQNDGTGSDLSFVVVFHDSEYANNGFGITAAQSIASGLDETQLSGGLRSFALDYTYRYYLNNNWQIFGEAFYERFSSEIENSPIARSNFEAEVSVGFIYLF